MITFLLTLLQVFAVLLCAPLMVGVTRKFKARYQNRRGASVFQPYWALLTLCRKKMTISEYTSWVFRVVPFVVLGSAVFLALIVPTVVVGGRFASYGDSLFLLGGVLAIGSLFLVLGGMDVASAFGGMGASREMTLVALVEPSILLFAVALGHLTDRWTLDGAMQVLTVSNWASHPFFVLSIFGFLFVLLAENARYPVDNPATHLELTMVHEAMILEYSGPYLAMLEYASAIKLTVFSVFFASLIAPVGFVSASFGLGAFLFAIIAFLVKVFCVAFLIASIESLFAKMRFYRMQEYMTTAFFLSLAGLLMNFFV